MCNMRTAPLAICFLAVVVCGDAMAFPANTPSQDHASPYMRVYGVARPPYAFVEFCERMPSECRASCSRTRIAGTPEQMAELDRINRKVNHDIAPATDMELYGVVDYWTIPTTKGDCEDYALLKRQTLMRAGWPASALLMIVYDEHHEGHAVLTARTALGDYVLDNKNDELRLWYQTPYEFVMRQSYLDPQVWMALDPGNAATSVPVAGPRSGKP
jgi:predicted transglutaminase-like cysteine proteinase